MEPKEKTKANELKTYCEEGVTFTSKYDKPNQYDLRSLLDPSIVKDGKIIHLWSIDRDNAIKAKKINLI